MIQFIFPYFPLFYCRELDVTASSKPPFPWGLRSLYMIASDLAIQRLIANKLDIMTAFLTKDSDPVLGNRRFNDAGGIEYLKMIEIKTVV